MGGSYEFCALFVVSSLFKQQDWSRSLILQDMMLVNTDCLWDEPPLHK